MKLIFMGTPDFAVASFIALMDSDHEVIAAYTQPPRPAGRGKREQRSPIHTLAESYDVPVYTPETLKDEAVQAEFTALEADAAVVVAYGLLLPKAILEGTKLGCINVHPSLLPRWRGAAPIQRPIMAGDSMTGICIMQMDEGLDTGPVYSQVEVPIPPDANAGMMHDALAGLGSALLVRTLTAIEAGELDPEPQADTGETYAAKIDKAEAAISFDESVVSINNQIRGLAPKPSAHITFNNKKIKILQAGYAKIAHDFEVGKTINDQFHIACKDGILYPLIVQPEGKKPMQLDDYLTGNMMPSGAKLS